MPKRYISIFTLILLTILVASSTTSIAQRDKKRKVISGEPSEARLREAEFYFIEAEKYYILEDYTKALQYFERVAELNPNSGTVYYKIAEILSKSNKEEDLMKASVNVDNAIRIDKKN
ncbi:MAG: tetratricopeptide repeat protein, partial [Cyclobacteriaceae bacterium]